MIRTKEAIFPFSLVRTIDMMVEIVKSYSPRDFSLLIKSKMEKSNMQTMRLTRKLEEIFFANDG